MKRQRGGAIVEFVLVMPFMIIPIFITTELGRAYYYYNTLTKNVREAARYLSVRSKGVDVDKAKKIIIYGNPAGTGNAMLPRLSLSNVPDPTYAFVGTNPVINTVTVTVSGYNFQPMVTSVFGYPINPFPFAPIRATMRSPT